MTLDPAGYRARRLAQWLTLIREDLRAELGADVDLTPGDPLGILADNQAGQLDELSAEIQALYDAFDDRNAAGAYLLNLGRLSGLNGFLPATSSRAWLELSGTPGTVIPAGSEVESTADGTRWTQQEAVTLDTTPIEVLYFAVETGPIEAAIDTISDIVTPVTGWTSATNPDIAIPGRNTETEEEFRIRRRQSLRVRGSASIDACVGQILELGYQVIARDNKTRDPLPFGHTSVPPLGARVVIFPSADTAQEREELANVIWRTIGDRAPTYGEETHDITDAQGQNQTMAWENALESNPSVFVTVTPTAIATGSAVKAAILEAYANPALGTPLRAIDGICAVGKLEGVTNVTVVISPATPGETTIQIVQEGDITIL